MNCFLLAMYYQITFLSPKSQALDQSRLQICNRRKRVMIAGMGTSWRVRIVCSALSLDRAQLGLWWCSSSQMPWNTHWPTCFLIPPFLPFRCDILVFTPAGMKSLWIIAGNARHYSRQRYWQFSIGTSWRMRVVSQQGIVCSYVFIACCSSYYHQ